MGEAHCSYVIRPPKTHGGRIYIRAPRYCKRSPSVHGRCWQHHDGTYYCEQCIKEAADD